MKRHTGSNRGGSVAVAAGALMLGLAGLAACGSADAPAEAAPTQDGAETAVTVLGPGDVVAAEQSRVGASVVLTGSLNPYRMAEVRAQVPGLVRNLRVDRGTAVKRGQVMATIQAEGIRSQAAGAQAAVAAAQANVVLAKRQLESARTLHAAGALSDIDFQSAQAGYEAAEAQLAAAKAQAAGAVESAQRTTVEAPFSGDVSNRMVNEGEAVNSGDPLFTVVNTDSLELAGQVPVDQVARVRVGQPVEFTLEAYPGRTFRGTVARVEPTADPATRQVGVYLRLDNTEHGLIGGLFATGQILTGTETTAIVVPIPAVRSDEGGSFVWLIENGTAVRRDVATGARDDRRGVIEITDGLAAGERVVVSPGVLTDGARVRLASDAVEDVSGTAQKASSGTAGVQ